MICYHDPHIQCCVINVIVGSGLYVCICLLHRTPAAHVTLYILVSIWCHSHLHIHGNEQGHCTCGHRSSSSSFAFTLICALCKHREGLSYFNVYWEILFLHELPQMWHKMVGLCGVVQPTVCLIVINLLHHCPQNFPKDASVQLIIKKAFELGKSTATK